MVKEQLRETNIARKVSHVSFGLMGPLGMQKASHIQVYESRLYPSDDMSNPLPHNALDRRMGVCAKGERCETCHLELADCVGHFGYLDLMLPCFHVGFFRCTLKILQMICKSCSSILLEEESKEKFLGQLYRHNCSYVERKKLFDVICKTCQKNRVCPKCGSFNGSVKKVTVFKIVHDKYSSKGRPKSVKSCDDFLHSFDFAKGEIPSIEHFISSAKEDLDPKKVLKLFQQIPFQDIPLLMMNNGINKPEDLILTRILVPPRCIRPSVVSSMRFQTNEDDLTMKVVEIAQLIAGLKKSSSSQQGAGINQLKTIWECLQVSLSLMYNSETSGIPLEMKPKTTMRGFAQRLKGKQGRFRGNLSGKRVDFSGRTVISPDPNMRIDEVAIPMDVAKVLTYPETVTPYNITFLRQLVINGSHVHPGAESVICHNAQRSRFSLRYGDRLKTAETLRIGDTVLRHVIDGDIILFNRQPSLHKLSIQSFKVRVMPHRTFRFNECCCNPFNADFDGDEMNIHLPQTEEAKAEAFVLMGSTSNIVTPRSGEPLIAAIQDFITGAFLLTQKDQFFDHARATQIIMSIASGQDSNLKIELPFPAILKPCRLWTGKQIFSLIISPNKDHPVKINLQCPNKSFTRLSHKGAKDDMCPGDGYVVIYNSQLMSGCMDKSTLGSGSKDNIFYVILCYFGQQYAADSMSRLAKLCPAFLSHFGFSIGLGDVTPSQKLLMEKQKLLDKCKFECDDFIASYGAGEMKPQPGCDIEQTLENKMLRVLSQVRDEAGLACLKTLKKNNTPLIMAVCGSKGSNINISQMIALVGQQAISGNRVPNGFEMRSLPHFERKAKDSNSRGFVGNSFYSGLTATEFIFHTMAGREGLVDTAVKTANTGYMQRRLVKNLEDLCVAYDKTVRTSTNQIVQFVYGADNLDPTFMEGKKVVTEDCPDTDGSSYLGSKIKPSMPVQEVGEPINFGRLWNHNAAVTMKASQKEASLSGTQICQLMDDVLSEQRWSSFSACFAYFKLQVWKHVRKIAMAVDKTIEKLHAHRYQSGGSVLSQVNRVTRMHLLKFLDSCLVRYHAATIHPGEAVGAICAQSIGEPSTQMTLKTFHFAGVASMNITLGVPRINEIINAAKTLKTPLISAALEVDDDSDCAQVVKARLDRTTLEQVADFIKEAYTPCGCLIFVQVNLERIVDLKLEVDMTTIISSIIAVSRLKIESRDILQVKDRWLRIIVTCNLGISSVNHAIVSQDDKISTPGHPRYKIFVEGDNLNGVMVTRGVKGTNTESNNILDVEKTLGIEAARRSIMHEISYTMKEHGMTIDLRHTMMLADLMTFTGQVHGVTRTGLAKVKESVLMLASFEKTADHLFDAAFYGQKDSIQGVSESIIMGVPMNIGTGMFKMLFSAQKPPVPIKRDLVFETPQFHLPECRGKT